MKNQEKYSDEYISAYIDGELDKEERTRLLLDEQTDETLSQRISEARILKEKVLLTYVDIKNTNDIKKSFSRSRHCFATLKFNHPALAASLLLITIMATLLLNNINTNDSLITAKQLIKNTQPIATSSITEVINDQKKIIINLSQYQAENFTTLIGDIETMMLNNTNKSFNVEIVASGSGVKALDETNSKHSQQINKLVNKFSNLKVVACAKSLAQLAIDDHPIRLMKSIITTPSVAQQVAKRTSEGWLYIKI